MGTMMLLGGMLMMLTPVTVYTMQGMDLLSVGRALRHAYAPEADIPDDMAQQIESLGDTL